MNECAEIKLVMVVEDDPDIREVTGMVVEEMGCRVILAENGQDALNWLRDTDQLPALILLDLMMPVMNGWEFMQNIGSDPTFMNLTVVVMSAVSDEAQGIQNVAEYIRKPLSHEQLAGVISRSCASQ